MTDLPIACTLSESELRDRSDHLLRELFARSQEVRRLDEGYAFRFVADDAILSDLMQAIRLERQCCRFLRIRLTVEPGGGPLWLELTGPGGTTAFLASVLGL